MARTKQLNVDAIIRAYEMEAKRAERNAKSCLKSNLRQATGEPLADYWTRYACKIRQQQQQIKVGE